MGDFMPRFAVDWGGVIFPTYQAKAYYFQINPDASVSPTRGPSERLYAYPLRCLSTAVEGEESG